MNWLRAALAASLIIGATLGATAQPLAPTMDKVPPSADPLRAALPDIKTAILRETGYKDEAVEVSATEFALSVKVLNSTLAEGTNTSRENEAGTIAAIIVNAVTSAPGLKAIVALHIDYVTRTGGRELPVDKIDFRKSPDGRFLHHIS